MEQRAPDGGATVSVVIPCHNAADLIGEQLEALTRQTYVGPFEVLVVDNLSTDELDRAVTAFTDRLDIRIVPASDRAGVSHARNVGCRASRGDFVAICDADDQVDAGWLEALVEAASGADVVGGALDLRLLNSPRSQRWREVQGARFGRPLHFLPFAQGANVGLWRRVFEAVDGWDEDLVAGGDDVDFAWRAQLSGFTLAFVPDAVVNYRIRDSLPQTMRQCRAYGRARAALLTRYRRHGARASSPRELGRELTWLLTRSPYLLLPSWRRGRWLVRWTLLMGSLEGSIRHRAWAL